MLSNDICTSVLSYQRLSIVKKYFGKNRIYGSTLCNTGVRHKENDKAVHLPFQVQEGVQAF